MKINPDCIRDVLLYLEENLTINMSSNERKFSMISLVNLYENLNYDKEEIWYSVYNLHQIRFIDGIIKAAGNDNLYICNIENITWNGHQFLNTIRPKSIWDATKEKAKQIGGLSLHSLSTISMQIMGAVATNPDFIKSIVDNIK